MIWSDPWITESGGLGAPPAPPPLPPGVSFQVYRACDMSAGLLSAWCRDLVGTAWSESAVRSRLEGAWIALLLAAGGGGPAATCVLRPRGGHIWTLETFVARPKGEGRGTLLVRHAVPWVWSRGCRSLIYTWELSVGGLAVAWWRGWLRTATAWWWGWVWKGEGCGFCGGPRDAGEPRFVMPMLFHGRSGDHDVALVSDSGLRDGWGYVLATRGDVDWRAVQQKGGWRALWYRGTAAPEGPGWKWTGEVVIVGVIGEAVPATDLTALLATAEIAP